MSRSIWVIDRSKPELWKTRIDFGLLLYNIFVYILLCCHVFHGNVCLFVCLHVCSVRRHTWVLMGPDTNEMLKPGFKLKAYISMLALLSVEIDRNRLKWKVKEKDHGHSQQMKLTNFTVSLWVKRREKRIQFHLPLMLFCRLNFQKWSNNIFTWLLVVED